jgi:hypothetical protein
MIESPLVTLLTRAAYSQARKRLMIQEAGNE